MKYIEIKVSKQRNSSAFFAKVIYRLHGYNRKYNVSELGVDFPEWHVFGEFDKIDLGSSLRIFGSRENLSEFLLKTNLMQFLIEGGVSVSGIQDIPPNSGFVRIRRDGKIQKRDQLIENFHSIKVDNAKNIDLSLGPIAEKMGVDVRLASELNRLMHERNTLIKKAFSFKVKSTSKCSGVSFNLLREIVAVKGSESSLSTYGFSKGDTTVPYF